MINPCYGYLTYTFSEDYLAASETNNLILEISPRDEKAVKRKVSLHMLISENENHTTKHAENQDLRQSIVENNEDPYEYIDDPLKGNCLYQRTLYEAVCNGEVRPSAKDMAELRCRYFYGKSPFLLIAPLKLEEISLDPYIVLFHDAAFDSEIRTIEQISKPQVEPMTIAK